MSDLLERAQLFLATAQAPKQWDAKAVKELIEADIADNDFWGLFKDIETHHFQFNNNPALLNYVADYLSRNLTPNSAKSITQINKKLADKIFNKWLDQSKGSQLYDMRLDDVLEDWAKLLLPETIKRYQNILIKHLQEGEESELSWQAGQILRKLLTSNTIRPHFDVSLSLLERLLRIYDPHQLPQPDLTKDKYTITDIMKLIYGRDKNNSRIELSGEKLQDIYQKSTPQAQQILRSVLWQSYSSFGGFSSRKFMLDEGGQFMDHNLRPTEVYGKVSPANRVSWNQYSDEDQAEKQKWQEIFNDFKLAPFIQF